MIKPLQCNRLTWPRSILMFVIYSNFLQYGASFGLVSRVFQKSSNLQMRGKSDDAPKKFTKSNLPSKDCIVCNRPFEWRKKWERCWDEVKYCSERCRRDGKGGGGGGKDDSAGNSGSKMKFQSDSGVQPTYRYNPSDAYNVNIFSTAVALPPISIQQQEMSMYNKNIKNMFGLATAIMGLTAAESIIKPSIAHAAGTTRPSKKEIAEMFLDDDWESKATILRKSSYRRLDEKPDSEYYVNPRFVEHIDEKAVAALLSFHTKQLNELSNKIYQESRKLDILDLCSSWTSHLSLSDYPDRTSIGFNQVNDVAGLGMNSAELNRNTQLSKRVVQDLNISPILPFESNSYDAILLQLSIDYLIKPLDVLAEAARVLRPGGSIFITFSNRVFIDKAVAGWTGKSDLDHIQTVGDYIHHSGGAWVEPFQAVDLSPSDRSDPLYSVIARKKV